jgi:hypothetical protein
MGLNETLENTNRRGGWGVTFFLMPGLEGWGKKT